MLKLFKQYIWCLAVYWRSWKGCHFLAQ